MFSLLTPAALLALLGLLVPVAIHLWNRRPGREVAVGSVRWLAAGANRRLRNLKPEQLWLLLLRAALLAVLAVALAGPVWRQSQPGGRGQVLLSPETLGNPALGALRPTIDSLRRRGYGLRWLALGFPRVTGAAWRADSLGRRDSARLLAAGQQPAGNFQWARVAQAAGTFPGQPLYVVSPASLRDLQGPHPPLAATITWQTLPTPSTTTWLQAAALGADSLRLLLGRSNETQTAFQLVSVARPLPGAVVPAGGLPPLRFETGAAGGRLQYIGSKLAAREAQPPVPVRSRPLRVVIYATAPYAADARYLRAGLRAAATGLPVPLALSTAAAPPNPATAPDWLFWLADAPLPAAWNAAVRRGTRVWQEATGPGVADNAQLEPAAANETPVAVRRRNSPQPRQAVGRPLWADGRGRAVLSRRDAGQGAVYRLHTRLTPPWSELGDSPVLPARLLALLQPELTDADAPAATALDQALAAQDRRALDPAQISASARPAVPGPPATVPPPVATNAVPSVFYFTNLRPWLVLVAGLLFALERLLARRREAQVSSATP
ncbi:BatA domain-containing protein [Hymenobacter sp.]|uniref:BatA domain-containing protein n=1 Tax=Hymenobacter sp. TaxID=1898978 RepID=UPI00286A9B63|nr:BatA domain-containing protein [Hymenobacter sp.]